MMVRETIITCLITTRRELINQLARESRKSLQVCACVRHPSLAGQKCTERSRSLGSVE